MRHRALAATLGLVQLMALAGPATTAGYVPSVGPDSVAPPTTTKVTPYVGGATLTWTAQNQLAAGGYGPQDVLLIHGVSGGPMGIVETGSNRITNEAASWVSKDGGASWAEHRIMSETSFGPVVAHGGVLVTTASGFYSSTDGATWTAAITGPHSIGTVKLAAGPAGFVAFVRDGRSTTTRVWRSSGGRTWSVAPVQSVTSSLCPSSVAMSSSRIVAIGSDCAHPQRARVVISTNGGRTWTAGAVPPGLHVNGTRTRAPSASYVGGRFVVTGGNATETATWVWSSADGRSWRHIASMPRTKAPGWTVDTIVGIFHVGAGYVAIGHRDLPADDAVLVAWRSTDLAHWTRFSPPTASTCDATVHMVSQAAVVGGALVAVGNPWSMATQCGETWRASVTP